MFLITGQGRLRIDSLEFEPPLEAIGLEADCLAACPFEIDERASRTIALRLDPKRVLRP